jgi:hypothetical protein
VNHERDMFDEEMLTRFQRGLAKMWVEVIYSKTPEGKWRVERSFQTHQDKMIKKMRLEWIKDIETANKYIEEIYIPEHNKKYAVLPKEKGDAHIKLTKEERENYKRYFAKETKRKVKKDGTVQYDNKFYQIKKWETLHDGNNVIVHETIDGQVEIYSGKSKLVYVKVTKKR